MNENKILIAIHNYEDNNDNVKFEVTKEQNKNV